ncbi:MBL fold metallo-hydrolase [Sporichthya sp.]|uniref:MBL fold metallo-hydrolase n=1 Tax=Sporichthya sp. TaxID=65475 RepID=UPI001857E275|nr:MBL fold metallo-hydrolase [Sporichthya sp.]MBA3742368.1 MBL fold metallo-hydrolase [Sporichthya sp.]
MTAQPYGHGAWTEPGAFEVAPDVHRIPLPLPNDGLRAVNVYVLPAGPSPSDGCVLIDSGWALAEARALLEESLGSIGYGLDDVKQFLVTHMHRDHYTLGIELQRLFGSKVALGLGEQPNIERVIGNNDAVLLRLLPTWGAPHLSAIWATSYAPEERALAAQSYQLPDAWITDGQQLEAGKRTLTAIETPGHTRGHMVFVDADASVMFTGDHVLPHITPSIGLEPERQRSPLTAYLSSLRLLLSHADALMLPAHGTPGGSVHVRVNELLDFHDVRLAQTLAAVEAGAGTPYEAARAIPWTRRNTAFDDLTDYNQILAVGETWAHLVTLAERSQIVESADGEALLTYELPS